MAKVLEALAASNDPVERELLRTLRAWQNAKAASGGNRSLGREPGQIAKYGAIAVIESRILRGSVGFDEVGPDDSYEAIVEKYQNRFASNIVELALKRLMTARKAKGAGFQI
jgi:hypothetical protein